MKPLYGTDQYWKLNLSSNFHVESDIEVDYFTFPGGEPHVKLTVKPTYETLDPLEPIRIYHSIKSFNDFGILCMAVSAIRQELGDNGYISLVLPYFPGARQDRVAKDVIEPLSVKVYADLINSLELDEVIIFDPHSEVAPALINNCIVLDNHKFATTACFNINDVCCLVASDAGSVKKIESLAQAWAYTIVEAGGQDDIIYFRKHRDMKTGKLTGFVCNNEQDLKGIACVVVDDICDGGGTFKGIAAELKRMNAGDLHLVISHGIFSGLAYDNLKDYKTITTTNSWFGRYEATMPDVICLDLLELYDL